MTKADVTVVLSGITGELAEQARALRAQAALFSLVAVAKKQADHATWIAFGGLDLEEFCAALDDGRWHPLLRRWAKRKGDEDNRNRPSPSGRERAARRMAVLMSVALERTGLPRQKARRLAADALSKAKIFARGPNVGTIRRWASDIDLTEADERNIVTAIERCDEDPHNLIRFFIGLIGFLFDPAPSVSLSPPC